MAPDLDRYPDIGSMAQAIRRGETNPMELTEACLDRIRNLDENLGAFCLVCEDTARAQARAAWEIFKAGIDLGPLQGIPFAVKDLFDVKGMPTTAGSSLLKQNQASKNAYAVQKCLQAAMVLLGKTKTVQFAYGGVGINSDCGTPRNPWSSKQLVPGGSSSGSAVAVASGMVAAALGTDTGGSVRIPAALCGVTGLKTTVGRVSRAGVYPLSWTLDSVGTLTRSVRDAALLCAAMAGPDPEDESTWAAPLVRINLNKEPDLRGIRLAFPQSEFWEKVDPDIEKAVRASGDVFKELGASLLEVDFPEARDACRIAKMGIITASEAYCVNNHWVEEHWGELDPVVAYRILKGKDIPAHQYVSTLREVRELRARALKALERVDGLLVPSTRLPALPVKDLQASTEAYAEANWAYLRNTSIGNVLNLCGISIPCGFSSEGLPLGLMIYAKPFEEETALRIGNAFQLVTDYHLRRPPLACQA